MIRGQNMGVGRWVDGEFVFVSPEKAESLSGNLAKPGDLIFTQRGTLGQVAKVPRGQFDRYLISQSQMKLTVDESKADGLFLYYLFSSSEQQDYIQRNAIQTGVPHTNLGILRNTPLLLPSLAEQRAIAHILGTLDDKIELNRRMNETLESMARAIFKSWFVDFHPVKRNQARKRDQTATSSEALAKEDALFPGSFEDSPLGKIPKGWRVGKMSELISLSREALNPRDSPDEAFDHYSIPAFDEGHWPKEEKGEQIKSNKLVVRRNSVLLSKLNPRIPRVWLPTVTAAGRSIASTEFLVALPHEPFGREYIYGLFTSQNILEVFETLVTGTSGSHQRVQAESMLATGVIVPTADCVQCFARTVGPLYTEAAANISESRTLAAIRDALLPRLISGEIRVKDAEQFLKETGL